MGFISLVLTCGLIILWVRSNNQRDQIEHLSARLSDVMAELSKLRASLLGRAPHAGEDAAPPAWHYPQPLPTAPPAQAPTPTPAPSPFSPATQYTPPEEVREKFLREQAAVAAEEEARLRRALHREALAMEAPAKRAADEKAERNFEFQFGKRLPVWIGGVALAFAGFYLVKYSIEQGWLTEYVRVILGFIFAAVLLFGARHIHDKMPEMADGARIAQALAGAGIAVLYVTFYAATMMYHFMSPFMGLCGMALVTALAVTLSVRHGMPIAVLGMMGGFLTPALIRTDSPSAPMLFAYLFVLVIGLYTTFRRLGWWVLGVPMALLAFAWIPIWVFGGHFNAEDGIYMGLFILALTGLIWLPAARAGINNPDTPADAAQEGPVQLHTVTAVAALGLMAFTVARCDYGVVEWGLFALLALGGMAMAYFRPAVFKTLPPVTMAVNIVMLGLWQKHSATAYAVMQAAFAALYLLPSLVALRRRPALSWGGLFSGAALAFYGLGYLTLHHKIYDVLGLEATGTLHFWAALALVNALVFAGLAAEVFRHFEGDPKLRDRLLALFCLMTTAFISIALTIEVHHDFLPVAFAAETLAVCWVASRIDIAALRRIAGILFTIFCALMLPQIGLLSNVALYSLAGTSFSNHMPALVAHPLFQLGAPMLCLGLGSWFLRLKGDSRLVELFEITVVALGALMAYYLTRHIFNVPADIMMRKAGFMERGVITNVFFLAGLATVWAGRQYSRRALLMAGAVVFGMALFRVVYFDLVIANPLWTREQDVGGAPLVNFLLLPYALPLFWLWAEERPQLRIATIPPLLRGGFAFMLVFVLASYNVRQFFHPHFLMQGETTNAETYTYSAIWLLLGAALLFMGTLKQNKPMRVASLVLMILTVGKVFLYDAGELTGLYRVASFLGLGFSLLGLSWFYSRFVFKKED